MGALGSLEHVEHDFAALRGLWRVWQPRETRSRQEDRRGGLLFAFRSIFQLSALPALSTLFRERLTAVLSGYRVLFRAFVNVVYLRRRGFEVETRLCHLIEKTFSTGC